MQRTTVLIVEAQPILSQGLAIALSAVDDLCVVGSALSSASAEEFAARLHPDVVVLDAGQASPELAKRLRAEGHGPAIVLLSLGDSGDDERTWSFGGATVVPGAASLQDLANAIRAAHHETISKDRLAPILTEPARPRAMRGSSGLAGLTPREIEIIQLLVQGMSQRAIAEELRLAVNTVRTHTRNIQLKLNVHSNLEAVSFVLGHV